MPYHAWSYDLGGQLRAGPNIKAVEGFRREDICLTKVQIENFCGFLFVNLDPDARPMDEWFPGVRFELAAHVPQIEQLRPLEWVEIPETCNWKVSVENYSECYHCTLNHETFATGIVRPETYDNQLQGHCLRHTTECQNLDAMSYPIDLSANDYAGVYSSWFLWPMFSFQVYPGNLLNTYHWRAVDADHVVVWRGWYSIDGVESETVRQLALQDRETTVEEDIHLVETVQRGLKSRGYRPVPLVLTRPAASIPSIRLPCCNHGCGMPSIAWERPPPVVSLENSDVIRQPTGCAGQTGGLRWSRQSACVHAISPSTGSWIGQSHQ